MWMALDDVDCRNACTANTAKVEYARITRGKSEFPQWPKRISILQDIGGSAGTDRLVVGGSHNAIDVLAAILTSADLP